MARDFARSERVAGQIRRDLARIIQREVKDPMVGFISVSDVEVTRDLSHAKVFVTVFDPDKAKDSIKGLRRAAAYLRHRLSQELRLRHVPELHFIHDDSVEQGSHIDSLIAKALSADKGHDERSMADSDAQDQDQDQDPEKDS